MKDILKSFENNLNYIERRRLNLVHQVLNQSLNFLQDKENLIDLFEIYKHILKDATNTSFQKSLETTIGCCQNFSSFEKELKQLQNNNPSSFIIVPLMAYGHMFSSVFRKIDDSYSATIVNKGDRYVDGQFIEYLFNEKQIKTVCNEISKENGISWITDLYKIFQENSFESHELNIENREQKIGNCFIKEPECSIKFAFATRNFSSENFVALLMGKEFSVKWEPSTLDMHRRFVERVSATTPNIAGILSNEFNAYSTNKVFRDAFLSTNNFYDSLNLAFNPTNSTDSVNLHEQFRKSIGKLDLESIQTTDDSLKQAILSSFSACDSKDILESLQFIKNVFKNKINLYGVLLSVEGKLSLAYSHFPFAATQLAYQCHDKLFAEARSKKKYESEFWRIMDICESIYPYNYHFECYKGAYWLEKCKTNTNDAQIKKDAEKAIICLNRSIELYPDYANAYYLLGVANQKLANVELSKINFDMALKLSPEGFKKWETKSPFQVFEDYFRAISKDSGKERFHLSKINVKRDFKKTHLIHSPIEKTYT